uniref:Uncharacterized protein n=1 Tax=Angiostrongylus cantonensis TaxID=6313 RepID=A0A0K0D6T8_ANGCA
MFSCTILCVSFWLTSAPSMYLCGKFTSNRTSRLTNITDSKSKSVKQKPINSSLNETPRNQVISKVPAKSNVSVPSGTPGNSNNPNGQGKLSIPTQNETARKSTSSKRKAKMKNNPCNDIKMTPAVSENKRNDICEYERKAADEGIVLQPHHVKHLGNIDEIAQVKKAQIEKEIESIRSDKELSEELAIKQGAQVRVNEKNCVLYETKDELTFDDREEKENASKADLYV